jgi:hypothetical protein
VDGDFIGSKPSQVKGLERLNTKKGEKRGLLFTFLEEGGGYMSLNCLFNIMYSPHPLIEGMRSAFFWRFWFSFLEIPVTARVSERKKSRFRPVP